MMNTFRNTTAALLTGLLIGTVATPVWSATQVHPLSSIGAEVMPAHSTSGTLLSPLTSLDPTRSLVSSTENRTRCEAGHIYSQHDIVGDRDACIMGGLTVSSGGGVATGVGR
jgi:hypothetical protein